MSFMDDISSVSGVNSICVFTLQQTLFDDLLIKNNEATEMYTLISN